MGVTLSRLHSTDEAEWWERWRSFDYSWDGLATKPWVGWSISPQGTPIPTEQAPAGSTPASLQDYWRDLEPMLIEGDGHRWTPAHLPMLWSDGSHAKTAWDNNASSTLRDILLRKLNAAAPNVMDERRQLVGADQRAQFQGVVVPFVFNVAKRSTPISAIFDRAFFSSGVDFSDCVFGAHADFQYTRFARYAANFNNTKFDDASFFEANIAHCYFSNVQFSQSASFGNATIHGDCHFAAAKFGNNLSFLNATISGPANFGRSTFEGNVDFQRVQFAYAAFSRSIFEGEVSFANAAFKEDAAFASCHFKAGFNFIGGKNAGETYLRGSIVDKDFSANGRRFEGRAHCENMAFNGPVDLRTAIFESAATFEGARWPREPRHWHGALRQTLFKGPANFATKEWGALAAFDGATFERGIKLHNAGEKTARQRFMSERTGAIEASHVDANEYLQSIRARNADIDPFFPQPLTPEPSRRELSKFRRRQRELRLRELEGGCRILKREMERGANKSMEQLLYRFELQSRRVQRSTPLWEKALSDLYGIVSDYGGSMLRPLTALTGLLVAFSSVFYATAVWTQVSTWGAWSDALQAFEFSWANVFRPLSALTATSDPEGTLSERLFAQDNPPLHAALVVGSTIESILAILLAFLFALSVRRRFQIT